MKNFDIFNPILKDAKCYKNNYYALALSGDINTYSDDRVWDKKKLGYKIATSLSDRKTESEKMVKAKILIYSKDTESLDWKSLYKNSKGVYFKKHKDNIYIS